MKAQHLSPGWETWDVAQYPMGWRVGGDEGEGWVWVPETPLGRSLLGSQPHLASFFLCLLPLIPLPLSPSTLP